MDREERDRLRMECAPYDGVSAEATTIVRLLDALDGAEKESYVYAGRVLQLLDALDAAEARAEKAEERLRWAEAKASVYGGEWCSKNMAEGRGPCGACASCCRQAAYDRDEWKARAEKAEGALRFIADGEGGDTQAHDWPEFWESVKRRARDAIERGDHRKGGE